MAPRDETARAAPAPPQEAAPPGGAAPGPSAEDGVALRGDGRSVPAVEEGPTPADDDAFEMRTVLPEVLPAADGGVPEAGIEALIATVQAYNPRSDAGRLREAHAYAATAHEGQVRRSGEPYITHPVAVAGILARQRMDDATIITALLHDTVEDTTSTDAEIARLFGGPIAELVDGVTKLTKIELTGRATEQAENFRKLFFAMSRDLRVVVVKLADRLHNMRTLRSMPAAKQEKKARETMEIYAPLAGRMGMQSVREELEDLAFDVLDPVGRQAVLRRVATLKRRQGEVDIRIAADLSSLMRQSGIDAEVFGRAKRPYSIWRKMQEKELPFERLSDIWGFRVIVTSEAECYQALGAIHRRWTAVPGRFKDYVSNPKSNGYRSLHTTVSGRDAKRVEVQIRTREMHDVAQAGVAAHWAYRDGAPGQNRFAVDPGRWVEAMAARFDGPEAQDDDAFLEHMKLELYPDQVFCFTPKGDVVQLPRGATPLDFAYAIHTRIGDHCVMAKVNGRRVPLFQKLRNGDSVEILTAEGQRPQPGWLEDVRTGRAKAAIRRSIRARDRERHVEFGRQLARAAFDGAGLGRGERVLQMAAERLGLPSVEEMLARIGTAELKVSDAVATLAPGAETAPVPKTAPPVLGLAPGQSTVRGRCCQPLPGERIIGLARRGEGVVLHAADCAALAEAQDQPDRWVDTRWAPGAHPPEHPVTLRLVIANSAGVLGRVCTAIGRQGGNVSDLVFEGRKPDYFRLRIEVELSDAQHLHRVVTALEAQPDVASVQRHRGPPSESGGGGGGGRGVE